MSKGVDFDRFKNPASRTKEIIMDKVNEAVRYILSFWDVMQRDWRERPDHVQKKFLEAEKQLSSNSNPSSKSFMLWLEDYPKETLAKLIIEQGIEKIHDSFS